MEKVSVPDQPRLKILIAGDWHSQIHEEAWARGLEELGHTVLRFPWYGRFSSGSTGLATALAKVENWLICGPRVLKLNLDLVSLASQVRPDAVILYRGTHVVRSTIRHLRAALPRTVIASYNNDDPFSPHASRLLWRHYLACATIATVNMVYRKKSMTDLNMIGARGVHLVRSAYLPYLHQPIAPTEEGRRRFESDVVFAGHYEHDGRIAFLRAVAEMSTVRLRLFGPEWDLAPRASWLERFRPIVAVRDAAYVHAIAYAKLALCFLSRLNSDTYTRRCFEVPAIGTFLLCQRSDDMESLLHAGVEADYFSTPEELVDKVRYYLDHPSERRRIAVAGQERIRRDGHDILSRMRQVERILRDARAPS